MCTRFQDFATRNKRDYRIMKLFYIIDLEYKRLLKFPRPMKKSSKSGAAHPVRGFCGHRVAATATQCEALPTEHQVHLPRQIGRGSPGA